MLKEKEKIEEIFNKLGLEKKIEENYTRDFLKNGMHLQTGKQYQYNKSERKIEDVNWIFYSGQILDRKDANPTIVLGEYYSSGMRHDIIVLHKNTGFRLATLGQTSYLYQDELEKNRNSLLENQILTFPNAAQFSRLEVTDIKSQIINLASIIKNEGNNFALENKVDITRTTLHFKKFLAEVYENKEPNISYEKINCIASEVWKKLI